MSKSTKSSPAAQLESAISDLRIQLSAAKAELNQVNGELSSTCAKNDAYRKQLYNILCDASRAQASILDAPEYNGMISVQEINPVLFALQQIIRTAKGG